MKQPNEQILKKKKKYLEPIKSYLQYFQGNKYFI